MPAGPWHSQVLWLPVFLPLSQVDWELLEGDGLVLGPIIPQN